jgi:alpha-tubulin suppressor-like RCC1 family protein
LWAWGSNANGRTGLNTTSGSTTVPTRVGLDNDWVFVSSGTNSVGGGSHSLAIKSDGSLWAWGFNADGRTGLNTTSGNTTVPTRVGIDSDWVFVSSGRAFSLAIKSDGSLWAWGSNANGRTGLNTTSGNTTVPTRVGIDSDWKLVAAGIEHSQAIKDSGTLWGWGSNVNGSNGTGSQRNSPFQVGTDSDWIFVSAGFRYSQAIKDNGTLWGWGSNVGGRNGTGSQRNSPFQVGIDSDWKFVSANQNHSQAIKDNGTLWGWGENAFGSNGTSSQRNFPFQVSTDSDWIFVSAGSGYSIAIKQIATLWGWGNNSVGQIGQNLSLQSSNNPLQIGNEYDWYVL